MNNLLSQCGSVDARTSASEKDLPVQKAIMVKVPQCSGLVLQLKEYETDT